MNGPQIVMDMWCVVSFDGEKWGDDETVSHDENFIRRVAGSAARAHPEKQWAKMRMIVVSVPESLEVINGD